MASTARGTTRIYCILADQNMMAGRLSFEAVSDGKNHDKAPDCLGVSRFRLSWHVFFEPGRNILHGWNGIEEAARDEDVNQQKANCATLTWASAHSKAKDSPIITSFKFNRAPQPCPLATSSFGLQSLGSRLDLQGEFLLCCFCVCVYASSCALELERCIPRVSNLILVCESLGFSV